MSKKQIGIIGALCVCLGLAAVFATPLFTKKKVETKVVTTVPQLAANRVYVMYVNSCPMCAKALKYLDEQEADNPYIVRVDLNTDNGKALLKQCRQKFGFKDIVIPLICADKEYSMGWSTSLKAKIRELSETAATIH